MKCTRAERWKSSYCLLWHFCFLTGLYRRTLRKSLLPFCGCRNAILLMSFEFFFLGGGGWAFCELPHCLWMKGVLFNEVTSLCVLLPAEAGFEAAGAWRVSLLLYFQEHTCAQRFPVEEKMNLPSREECEGWDEAQVAFFMCKVSARKKAISVKPA